MTLYYLTTIYTLPTNLSSLLGIGLKVYPIQHYTASNPPRPAKIKATPQDIDHDLLVKSYFSISNNKERDTYEPKMYINNSW